MNKELKSLINNILIAADKFGCYVDKIEATTNPKIKVIAHCISGATRFTVENNPGIELNDLPLSFKDSYIRAVAKERAEIL